MKPRGSINLLFILFLCSSGRALFAGTNEDRPAFIVGKVTDKQSLEPIPDVNIMIVGTPFGTSTDSNGRFTIGPLKPGLHVLEFSHVSYERTYESFTVRAGDTVTCNVSLSKRSILLDPVEITADPEKSVSHWHGTSGRVFTRKDIEGSGVRRLSDLVLVMAPGAFVLEMGPDLIIDLNKSSRRTTTRSAFRDYPNTNPLVILNGMRIGKSPQSLNLLVKPEEIDEIVLMKGTEASMYGYEGRDGVILINTTPEIDSSGLSLMQKVFYISGVFLVAVLAWSLIF